MLEKQKQAAQQVRHGAAPTGDVQGQLRSRKRLQRNVDVARSRIVEIKDLVRTALSHSFVSALQQRMEMITAHAFTSWAKAAGLTTTSKSCQSSQMASGTANCPVEVSDGTASSASATAVISPALRRLGARESFGKHGQIAIELFDPAADQAAPNSASTIPSPPVWIRRATSFGSRAERRDGRDATPAAPEPAQLLMRRTAFGAHRPEEVLATRGGGKIIEYRIKWKGFASEQSATWELASQLQQLVGFKEALARFEQRETSHRYTEMAHVGSH